MGMGWLRGGERTREKDRDSFAQQDMGKGRRERAYAKLKGEI